MNKSIETQTQEWYRNYYEKSGKDRNSLRNPQVLFQVLAAEAAFVRATYVINIDPKKAIVLDVGCRSGGLIHLLLGCEYQPENITGIDILPGRIMEARRRYSKIKFTVGDAGDMEFDPASFDLVTESTIFVQITDDGLAQSIGNEMLRVLKPGGYLLLIDWRMRKPYDNSYRALTRERLNGLFDVGKSS